MSTEENKVKKYEQESPFLNILTSLINRDGGLEAIKTIADLYEKERNDRRRIAFYEAMAKAQGEMEQIIPNAINHHTRSHYATYDNLDSVVRPIYTKHGFSLSFTTKKAETPDTIDMYCNVSHDGGWTVEYYACIPADGKGARGGDFMNRTQAAGSGFSYGMRYLLKLIWNLAIKTDDDDGNAAGKRERPKPPTKPGQPQDDLSIEKMKVEIWKYCLAETDGDDDKAQAKLYEITTGWKNVNGKREKHFEGVTDVDDQDFNDKRVQYVYSQLYRKQQ